MVSLANLTTIGFVVARFKESLNIWAPVASETYLYAKFNTPQANDTVPHSAFKSYVQLDNIGREGHTYCYHIVSHYDELEDVLVMAQAEPFMGLLAPETTTVAQMRSKALAPPPDPDPDHGVTIYNHDLLHDLAEWGKIDWSNPNETLWITPSELSSLTLAPFTIGDFFKLLLEVNHPPAIEALHGATFAVRKEAIRQHPIDVYIRALAEYEKANATNPEMGFFMERLWLPIWSQGFWLPAVEDP